MPMPAKFERFLNQDGSMKIKDYCTILDIKSPFTDDDVDEAYKRLARVYHPDRNGGSTYSTTVFQAISDARDKLINPLTRDAYLESVRVSHSGGSASTSEPTMGGTYNGPRSGTDDFFETYFQEFFRTHAGYPRNREGFAQSNRASAHTESAAPDTSTPKPVNVRKAIFIKCPSVISLAKTHGSFDTYNVIFMEKVETFEKPSVLGELSLISAMAMNIDGGGFFRKLSTNLTSLKPVNFNLHAYDSRSEKALRITPGTKDKMVLIAGGLVQSVEDRLWVESRIRECQSTYPDHNLYTVHIDGDDNIHLEPFSQESFERAYLAEPVNILTYGGGQPVRVLGQKLLKLAGDFVEQSILSSAPVTAHEPVVASNPAPKVEFNFFRYMASVLGVGGGTSTPAPKEDKPSNRPS